MQALFISWTSIIGARFDKGDNGYHLTIRLDLRPSVKMQRCTLIP
jgi:hypothetical protein